MKATATALTNSVSNPWRFSKLVVFGGCALAVGVADHYQPELLDPDTQSSVIGWLTLGLCVVVLAAALTLPRGPVATRLAPLGEVAQMLWLLADVLFFSAVVRELAILQPALAPMMRQLAFAIITAALGLSIATLTQSDWPMCALRRSKFPPTHSPPDCP
jgi:hypothetical protein